MKEELQHGISSKNGENWDYYFGLLKDYKSKYNGFPISNQWYRGVKLGLWFTRQWALYYAEELSKDQIDKLNSIGADLGNEHTEDYYNEAYLCMPMHVNSIRDMHKSNYEIKVWYYQQLQLYYLGKLSEEEIQLFQKYLLDEALWDFQYRSYLEYIECKKHNLPAISLYSFDCIKWVKEQKAAYQKGMLSDDKIEKLKMAGIQLAIQK